MSSSATSPPIHPSPVLFAGGAVLAQVFYPLVYGGTRDALTVLSVLLFCLASITHATLTRGPRTAVTALVVFGGGGLLVEALGIATGFPFGRYDYDADNGLGPTLLGVPVVVALAWAMMAWPSWIAAGRLVHGRVRRVAVAAWALAAWDLFLDPQMVAEGHWRWTDPEPGLPGVFGVPLTNHLGWLAVALVLMTVFDRLEHGRGGGGGARGAVADRLDAVPVALYLWVYLSSLAAHLLFFGLVWSAVWGGVGMGLVALPLASRGVTR